MKWSKSGGDIRLHLASSSGGIRPLLGAAARLLSAVKEGGSGGGNPASLLLSPGSSGRCLVPPYVWSQLPINRSTRPRGGRHWWGEIKHWTSGMTDADGGGKKAIKHCFKDGNGALGGKLLLTVICRIAPRILIDWLLWSLWSRGNARLLFMVGHNQKIAAGFGSTIALPKP